SLADSSPSSAPTWRASRRGSPRRRENSRNSARNGGHSSSSRAGAMKKVIVRAPVRADLAGGTLDLWPIYLFHPGSRTVNVAVSYYAESEVCETGEGIEIHLTDQQYRQRYESLKDV